VKRKINIFSWVSVWLVFHILFTLSF